MKNSKHAEARCRQRGFSSKRLRTILEYADIDRPIGGNCRLLRISHQMARSIRGSDGLASFSLIVSDTTGKLVTLLTPARSRCGRRYRTGR